MSRTLPAVIFDLDGTLADSLGCVVDTLNAALAAQDLPQAADGTIRSYVGLPLAEIIARVVPARAPALTQRVMTTYLDLYPERAAASERCFDGAVPLLRALRASGRRLAIATGKAQKGADTATARLGIREHFHAIHGILPGTPGKPHPAVLERALASVGARPQDAIVVGDTLYDLEMARAAGVPACAVTWGVHSREVLESARPEFLVEDFAALADVLG